MGPSDTKKEGVAEWRERIDALDDEIIELLLKRIDLSSLIMKSKSPAQIVDPEREQEILMRYSGKLSRVSTAKKSKRLALGIIAASSFYPES